MMFKSGELRNRLTALHFSLALHVLIIFMLIIVKNPAAHRADIMVIDFTVEDAVNADWETTVTLQPNPNHRLLKKNDILMQRSVREASDIRPVSPVEPVKVDEPLKERPVLEYTETQSVFQTHPTQDIQAAVGASSVSNGMIDSLSRGDTRSTSSGVSAGESLDAGKIKYLKANFSYIKDLIHKNIVYPENARRMGWEGKAIVSFVVTSHGSAKDVTLVRSSGHSILDRNALQAVNNSTPFPKPPLEAQIIVPILYRLK